MDIYELLHKIVTIKKGHLSWTIFSSENKNQLNDKEDKKIFDLIKSISSLALRISDDGVEFFPLMVTEEGRTFAIEDLTEEDYILLKSLDLTKLPLNLKARIADVLWCQKKEYSAAVVAAETYFELFNLWFNDDEWIEAFRMMQRALYISMQVRIEELHEKCCQTIYNHIIRLDGKDENFLSISLIRIILKQSFGDIDKILDILNNIIISNKNDINKTEQAYLLKLECFKKKKEEEAARRTNIELAECFLKFAEDILKTDKMGAMRVQGYFQKAIMLYRNNGEPVKSKLALKRLVDVQKKIPSLMQPIKTTFDAKKIRENIIENMKGLTFEESIIRLTQMVSFYKKDEFKQKVIEDLNSYPISNFFTKNVVNEEGQIIFVLPPLSDTNPEDGENLDMHIHSKMNEFQEITGSMYLSFALSYIKETFDIEEESFDFLVNNNFIIPQGREKIICLGISLAFQGHYYEALHILAPQVEHIFRNIAKETGGLTVTLENDGTSKEKVLSSIFDLPELKDCYNNDILFMFKGLLNEQAGANIRNNIAHGIMNPRQGHTGASLFFIVAVIKLLVISSKHCVEILKSQPQLQSYTNPDSSALDISSDSTVE